MDKLLGNRLKEFREEFGYSINELANLLNISSDLIIKIEEGEVDLTYDQLHELANIYHVSISDLIDTNKKIDDILSKRNDDVIIEEEVKFKAPRDKKVHFGKESFYKFYNKKKKQRLISSLVLSISLLLTFIIYLVLGLILNKNNLGFFVFWPIFFIGFLPSSIYDCYIYKDIRRFNIVFLVISIYLIIGLYGTYTNTFNGWSPSWVIFLIIPIFYIITNLIDKLIKLSKIK